MAVLGVLMLLVAVGCGKDKKSKCEFKKNDKCCAGKKGKEVGKCRCGKQGEKSEKYLKN